MIAIIDYGAGNIRSVANALNRLNCPAQLSADPEVIRQADKVIFPGVGSAGSAMEQLRAKNLDQLIPELQQPVLGICLGMQLMCGYTEEDQCTGLGIFEGVEVRRFQSVPKVPHMAWNGLDWVKESALSRGLDPEAQFYFVHSFQAELSEYTSGTSTYGQPFSAVLEKNNFFGVQFHPEKSSTIGASLIQNFLEL